MYHSFGKSDELLVQLKQKLMNKKNQTVSGKLETQFNELLIRIQQAKQKAYQQFNTTLVEFYWNIGKYVLEQVAHKSWGKSVVEKPATFIKSKDPNIKGFSARNIWTMKQFYEIYQHNEKLPSLVVEYALSRSLSSTVISEYETRLIPKKVLRQKLNEFYVLLEGKKVE